MAQGTQSLELELLGQKILLKSEGDPEVVREVVALVSRKLSEAEERGKPQAPHIIALLAMLDLAKEYVQAKRNTVQYQQLFDEKAQEIQEILSENLSKAVESE